MFIPHPPPAAIRPIASAASRQVLYIGAGAALTGGIALATYLNTKPEKYLGEPTPDKISRNEAKRIVSGPFGATTLLPLMGALLCLGVLYTKSRVVLGETAAEIAKHPTLAKELNAAGAALIANEAAKTKSLYTFLAGGIAGSFFGGGALFWGIRPS